MCNLTDLTFKRIKPHVNHKFHLLLLLECPSQNKLNGHQNQRVNLLTLLFFYGLVIPSIPVH